MAIFLNREGQFEAVRLVGTPEQVSVVYTWMEAWDLPRLVDPAPHKPFNRGRMVNDKGETHTPGFYVDPLMGVVIVRNKSKQVLEADYGDWIVRNTDTHDFLVVKDIIFKELFEEVSE